ncbi:hypothetical protein ACGFX8_35470 [Streptomyces sp. NPDC048362]|uniref:hypothetical protein n=1 Tax=Streptomyces sp. NPDC048362 TaxID=3365539 RepID=UPI00372202C3
MSMQSCTIQPKQSRITADGYALTNIQANYRTDAPKKNAYAVYTLSSEPQDCVGGEFFVVDVLTRHIAPMASNVTSVADWRDVAFTMPAGQRFVQVMYGDPTDPWDGSYIGSVSKLMP